jgi:hypothetical protein
MKTNTYGLKTVIGIIVVCSAFVIALAVTFFYLLNH